MINIKPVGDKVKIRETGLYQWDEVRTLVFEDPYPEGTEVHFSHLGELVATVHLLEEGSVKIPTLLLQKTLPIMAWVYVNGKTVLEIEMPVERRARPSNYIGVPDGDPNTIEPRTIALEQWQLEAIDQITDRYTKDETDGLLAEKANTQQEDWITPTLLNGWENYGDPNDVKFMIDSLGFVHVKGRVKSGASGSAIFTFPVGYRNFNRATFPCDASGYGFLNINNGTVYFTGNTSSVWLNTIYFMAEE